jgi:hypothetical protein
MGISMIIYELVESLETFTKLKDPEIEAIKKFDEYITNFKVSNIDYIACFDSMRLFVRLRGQPQP